MRSFAFAVASMLLAGGCGSGTERELPASLAGDRVATLAERQLEAENPQMTPGTMTCPELRFEVGAEVRCVRVAVLSKGRQIRVRGTVRVTGVDDGGRLHVKLDEDIAEYGVPAAYLESDLRARIVRRYGKHPDQVTCPYLKAQAGARARCEVRLGEKRLSVALTVTACDEATYTTHYRWDRTLLQRH